MTAEIQITIDTAKLDRLIGSLPVSVDTVMGKVANDAVAKMADHMAERKSGLVYAGHQASAPGEAPAIDTGHLINTLYAKRIKRGEWEAGTTAEYGPHLEFGTTQMEARPFFVRSLTEVAKNIIREIKAVFT